MLDDPSLQENNGWATRAHLARRLIVCPAAEISALTPTDPSPGVRSWATC